MFNIYLRTIKEKKWTLLIYCVAVILFLFMYIALFPTVSKSFSGFTEYFETFPKGFMEAFGFDMKTFVTFEGYLGSEQYSFIWPILLIALVTSLGSSFFSGEIEKGTIEILLSQPISRMKIFFGKFMGGISYLVVFIVASILSVFPLAEAYNVSYESTRFLKLGLVSFIFGLAVFGLAVLFSVVFSEKSKVSFAVVGMLITMYVLNIVSGLKESLDKLKYISFFYYFKPPDILVYNKISHWTWWVFLGTFFITTAIAIFWFKRRDIAI